MDRKKGQEKGALGQLRDRVLDLTYRNRLLNAREGKLVAWTAEGTGAGTVEDALAAGRKVLVVGEDEGLSARQGEGRLALRHPAAAARAKVTEIYRRAKGRYEETGLQTAYVGLGVMEWTETDRGSGEERTRRAPILLQPVHVVRKQAAGPYWLEEAGPATPNTTLLEWLRRLHGVLVSLPDPLPEDESGLDVDALLRLTAEAAEDGAPGRFKVGDGVVLGIFEYARLALWSELEGMAAQGLEHLGDLARELLGQETEAGFGPGTGVSARALERGRGRQALPCPVEADASQTEAIAKAMAGESFVLEGPPGTGKSQTIANIVATQIAAGRRVLFCAEKRAAIDAVAKRLEEVGLAHWCLDLHEAREGGEVVRDIARAVEQGYKAQQDRNGAGEGMDDDPTEHRDRLNAYGEALHAERGWGLSVHAAMGRSRQCTAAHQALPGHPGDEPEGIVGRCERVRQYVLARAGLDEKALRVGAPITADGEVEETLEALGREAEWVQQCVKALSEAEEAWTAAGTLSWWRRWWRRRGLKSARHQAREDLEQAAGTLATAAGAVGVLGTESVDAMARRNRTIRTTLRCNQLRSGAALWWAGCGEAVEATVEKVRAGDSVSLTRLLEAMEGDWWWGWTERWMSVEPVLRDFGRREHEDAVQRFRAREDEWMAQGARSLVEQRCRSQLALPELGARSREETEVRGQVRAVLKEGRKRRRLAPARRVLAEAGPVVRQVKPCVMVSPLNAARTIPKEDRFDLLVMDEASQIRPEDALGVVARSAQVVLAGDPQQMPPTSFFARGTDDEEDDAIESMESILDVALARRMPVHRLTFHYRSRYEDLIAFSNRRYYAGELVTFPDPGREERAVEYRHVGGVYEAQRNVREAQVVASYVAAQVKAPEGRWQSIGVVTFNTKQQRLIEDLLDKARQDDPAVEEAWHAASRPAPCVRNLETAQGDERDVIVLSTTFGPDPAGRQRSQFGPLNGEGGHRRLNVAITRAREKMVVFTSLDPEKIGTPQSPRGVKDLRAFLCYARDGEVVEAREAGGSVGGYDSPLEEQIAGALEGRGWEVVPQVGMAGYRIDIGVVHPEQPGRYLAGVEADGAQYHSAQTARDRDRLRHRVLEGKGWKLLRVWSPDWWRDREGCTERLDRALRSLAAGEATGMAGNDI